MEVIYGKSALRFKRTRQLDPLPEQIEDARQMYDDRRGLLISDAGYGKTLCVLLGLEHVQRNHGSHKALIVVPSIASFQWAVSIASFLLHKGLGDGIQVQVLRNGGEDIDEHTTHLIVTYGTIARRKAPIVPKIREWKPDVTVCDEYECMTSMDSNTTQIILGTENVEGLIDLSEWKWMLTGTPIPRYNDGLFPVLNALYPDVLEDYNVELYESFISAFCTTRRVRYGNSPMRRIISGSKNNNKLNELLHDGCKAMRRKLDLGIEIIERTITVDIKPSKRLAELTREFLAQREGMATDDYGNPVADQWGGMAEAQKLLGVEKAPAVAEYLMQETNKKEAAGDMRGIVCMYWHTEAGETITDLLNAKGYPAERISGSDSAKAKYDKAELMNTGQLDVLVCQISAAGKAIDIQRNSNQVVRAERDWSYSREEQAYRRVVRRGQADSTVFLDTCETTNPIEQPKVRVVARKKSGAALVLDKKET